MRTYRQAPTLPDLKYNWWVWKELNQSLGWVFKNFGELIECAKREEALAIAVLNQYKLTMVKRRLNGLNIDWPETKFDTVTGRFVSGRVSIQNLPKLKGRTADFIIIDEVSNAP